MSTKLFFSFPLLNLEAIRSFSKINYFVCQKSYFLEIIWLSTVLQVQTGPGMSEVGRQGWGRTLPYFGPALTTRPHPRFLAPTLKMKSELKSELRHLFQCCIFPRKCPRKTPFQHTVPLPDFQTFRHSCSIYSRQINMTMVSKKVTFLN